MALPVTPFDTEVSYSVGSGFAVTAEDTQARKTNSLPFQCTCSPRFSFFDCDEDVVTGGNERPDNTVSSMIMMSEDTNAPHMNASTAAENETQSVKNVTQVHAARDSMRQGHTRRELSSQQPLHKQGVMPLQSGSFEDTTNCMQESQETAVMRADEQYDNTNKGGVEVSGNDGYEEGQVVCCSADLPAHLRRFMTNNNNNNNMGANLLASTGAQSGTSCTTPCPLSPAAASAGVTPQLPYVELGADYGKAYMNNSRSGNMTSHSLTSYTVSGVNGMTGGCSGVFAPSASYSNATLTATTNNGNHGNGMTTASYDAASASYAWTSGADFNGEGGTAEYCSPMVLMTTTPSVSSWMCAAASPTTTTTQQNMNTNNMTTTPQPQSTREEYVQPCEMTITGLMSGSQDYYSNNSGSNVFNNTEEKGSRTSSPVTNTGAKAGRKSHSLALHPADLFAVPSPAAQHQHGNHHHHHHLSPSSNASRVSFSHHVDPTTTGTPSQDVERPLPYQGQAPMPLSPSLLTQSRPQSRATNTTSDIGQSGLDDLTDNADEENVSEEGDAVRSGMKEQNTVEENEKNGVVRHETSAATTTGTFMSNSATTGGLSHEAARSITSSNRSRAMSATSCTNASEARRREMSTTDRLTLSRCGGATIHIEPTVNVSGPASDPVGRTVRQAQGTPEWTAGTRGWLSGRNEDQTYNNTSTLSTANNNNNNNTPTLTPPSAIGKESGWNSSVGSLTPGMSSQGRGNTTTLTTTTTTTNTMNPATAIGNTPGVFVTPSTHARSDKTSPITSTPLPNSQSDLALPSPMNVRTMSSAFLQAPPPTTQENTPLYTAFSRSALSESSPATMSAMMSTGLWLPCSPPFTVPPTTTTTNNTNASLVNAQARLVLSDPTMNYTNAPTSTTTSTGVTMPTYYQSFATGQALNLPTSESMARNATTAITTPQGYFMYSGAEGGLLSGGGNNMPLYMTSASPMTAGYAPITNAPTTDSYVVSSAPSGGLVEGQTFGFSFPAPSYLVSAQDSTLPTATNNNNSNASLGNNVNLPHFATHITSAGVKAPFTTSTTTTSSVSNAMPPTSSSSPSFSFAAASVNAVNQANCNSQARESSYTNSTAVSYPPLSHYVVGEDGLFYFSQSNNTNNGTVEAANKGPEENNNSNTAASAPHNHSSPARSDSMQRNETPRLLVIGSASNPSIHRRWSNVHGALIGSARYVPYNESAEPALTTIITAVNLQDFASRVLVEPCGLNNTNSNAYNAAQLATLQNTLTSLNPWCRAAIVQDFLSKQNELACNVNAAAPDPHSQAILDALGATVVHRELSAQEQAMTSYLISSNQHTNTNITNAAGNDTDTNGMGGYVTMRPSQNGNEEQESVNAMLRALSTVSPTANSQHHSHHHTQYNTNETENHTMPCMVVGTKVITSAYTSQAAGDAAALADGSNHFHHHHSNTSSALANAQIVPIFVQMFPCELRDRMTILNHVIAKTCGPEAGVVVGLEFRSETSFIALVRTSSVWWLIYQLRCRVLMDRHGFWYAENMEQYLRMKLYCEAVRRLPQQTRHFQTDGLPCMPLVVELSRSVDPMRVIGSPAPQCFDEVVPISSLDRRGARVYHSHPQQPRMMRI